VVAITFPAAPARAAAPGRPGRCHRTPARSWHVDRQAVFAMSFRNGAFSSLADRSVR
jgi:hypothetical protein